MKQVRRQNQNEICKLFLIRQLRNAKTYKSATYLSEKAEKQGLKIPSAVVRKLIHQIRLNNEIPGLISSNYGYKVASNKHELKSYIESLSNRTAKINAVVNSLEKTYAKSR